MSLLIITAKDGAQYQADPRTLANLRDLRAWIEDHAKIAAANQILLSGRGTQLREATLATETEVFVFDRKILDHNTKPPLLQTPSLASPPSPPTEPPTQKDHAGWIAAFKKHLQWAESVLTKGRSLAAAISTAEAQMKNIQRSVVVAADNLDNHVVTFQNKLHDRQEDAGSTLRNQEEVFNNWENSVRIATQVTLHTGFMNIAQRQANSSRGPAALADLVNVGELKKAHAVSELKAQEFINNMENVRAEVEDIVKRNASLRDDIQRTAVGSSGNYQSDEPQNILEDMEAMTKRLHGDQSRVQDAHSLAQVAKWAQTHTKDVLPVLGGLLTEMSRLHQQAISQKNNVILAAHKNMIGVVQVQSSLGFLSPLFEKAQLPESESFLFLARAHRLPDVYGALLIECVRRREWSEKLMTESRRLAEELASLKNEEEKRRKKWQNQVGNMLPFTVGESRVLSLEVNLEGNDDRWPQVSRQDVEAFLEQCKHIPQMENTLKEVTQLYHDLDKPRKPTRRVKGFKAGSVHEAVMGASSYLMEDARELQDKVSFLENQDLNQKSRIRRLEDLLHRAYGRAGSGFPPSSPIPGQYSNLGPGILGSSPSMNGMNGIPPQGPPVPSRRLSANMEQSERERNMAAKILSLETDLSQEKERTLRLQKEAADRVAMEQQINERIMEADHTKIDLLANLEAQQQEFVLERKEFQRGLAELRQELDEAYEDLHRVEELKSVEMERKKTGRGSIARRLRN
ncbi:hypothetical protein L211DRAFT_458830 [Terfezia boudieri ATCC MYA-4762]|uniref:Autophagy-related protein 11 n=1 Tax=Terfezia boudieri ATCC MYA-4762 TaxID=1051890 RepID=A0A3N4LHV5_9PEZI|nr:hypothetical protein L211DRAFT_458830 [Terfezia boudieri ATCC MYA-4762]